MPVSCHPEEFTFTAPKPFLSAAGQQPLVVVVLPLQKNGCFHENFTLTRAVLQRQYHSLHSPPNVTLAGDSTWEPLEVRYVVTDIGM